MPCIVHLAEDLGFTIQDLDPDTLVACLDGQIARIVTQVEDSALWRRLADPATPLPLVIEALKEVYLEISMYGPLAIEGAVRAIAQFPRRMPVAWWDEMLQHQVEQFDHGETALRDYVALGGDEGFARARATSPSAFAVSAVWTMIAEKRDPFLYLGAVYLFDALTPILPARSAGALAPRDVAARGLRFATRRSAADIERTARIAELIADVAARYPEKIGPIAYGFAYLRQVYPLPVWDAALRRAQARFAARPLVPA
jgi:hypothetical protein